jgi:hypothetical protein
MMDNTEEKSKSTVAHRLKRTGKNPEFDLLVSSVLFPLLQPETSPTSLASYLQRAARFQYYRAITADPDNKYGLTYCLNCNPAGFKVSPMTRSCTNPKVCPWCFVRRRLVPTYNALMDVPDHDQYQLLYWRRSLPCNVPELPFFSAKRGPHQWSNAKATVQMVLPGIDDKSGELRIFQVGVQVIHDRVLAWQQMRKRTTGLSFRFKGYDAATSDNIIECIGEVTRLPWLTLFTPDQLPNFQSLLTSAGKSRLIRINQYKPKGI